MAARREDPPTFWLVVIPEEVYELGRPRSTVPVPERLQGAVRMTRAEALKLEVQHSALRYRRGGGRSLQICDAFPPPAQGAAAQ